MMMFEAVGGLVLLVALTVFGLWAFYRAGRSDGYELGYAAAMERAGGRARLALVQDRAVAGRHRVSQPRASSSPAPAAKPGTSTREGQPIARGMVSGWMLPPRSGWPVSAADIGQVLMPPAPAPDKRGAADTGRLPRVRLSPGASTGEIRSVGDELVAAIERGDLG